MPTVGSQFLIQAVWFFLMLSTSADLCLLYGKACVFICYILALGYNSVRIMKFNVRFRRVLKTLPNFKLISSKHGSAHQEL